MDTNILNDYIWLLLAGIVTLVITAFKTGISSFISDRIKKFLEKVNSPVLILNDDDDFVI